MVLTEKRFLEDAIEFAVQTDLFDNEGTMWQSVTRLTVPFHQETLLVPLSSSGAQLDDALLERANSKELSASFACTRRNLIEFEEVGVADITGTKTSATTTPLMWMLGQCAAILERQERIPALPLMCNCVFGDDVAAVPLEKRVSVSSWTSGESDEKPVIKFDVASDQASVMTGLIRTVGWTYTAQEA